MRNTKLIVSAAVAITAIAAIGAASAADLPARTYTKAPAAVPVVTYNWTGIYVGGQIGGAWSDSRWLTNHRGECGAFAFACDPVNQTSNSFLGGGQIGGRWQTGSWVFGIEGTAAYAKLDATSQSALFLAAGGPSPANGGGLFYDTRLHGIYTGTAQIGYAWDRTLWYVKGGYAGSQLFQNSTSFAFGATATAVAPVTRYVNGWTVGTGVEYAVWQNVSVGLEYDYIHLAAGDVATCTTGPTTVFSCLAPAQPLLYTGFNANISQVVARVNYKFGGPVVAKY
jgi:outer membrane immunogenic protein